MSEINKWCWDVLNDRWLPKDNVDLPEIFCGICNYNLKNNLYPFSKECPKCEQIKQIKDGNK